MITKDQFAEIFLSCFCQGDSRAPAAWEEVIKACTDADREGLTEILVEGFMPRLRDTLDGFDYAL